MALCTVIKCLTAGRTQTRSEIREGLYEDRREKRCFTQGHPVLRVGLAFSAIILLIWFDELCDIPYHFLGGQKTPVNWQESLFESAAILLLEITCNPHNPWRL